MRWGIGDFFWIFFGGVLASILVGIVFLVGTGWDANDLTDSQTVMFNGVSGIAQFGGFGLLLWVLLRVKGGGLVHDLGLVADRAVGPLIGCFFGGMGAQIVLGLAVYPITNLGDGGRQELVDQIDEASGASVILLVVTAAVLAPVFEELLFRGVLLRSLLRRMAPVHAVLVSSVVFGVIHLFDPEALAIQPALIGMGLASAVLALRGGGMLRSIALHAGFNAITVVGLLLT